MYTCTPILLLLALSTDLNKQNFRKSMGHTSYFFKGKIFHIYLSQLTCWSLLFSYKYANQNSFFTIRKWIIKCYPILKPTAAIANFISQMAEAEEASNQQHDMMADTLMQQLPFWYGLEAEWRTHASWLLWSEPTSQNPAILLWHLPEWTSGDSAKKDPPHPAHQPQATRCNVREGDAHAACVQEPRPAGWYCVSWAPHHAQKQTGSGSHSQDKSTGLNCFTQLCGSQWRGQQCNARNQCLREQDGIHLTVQCSCRFAKHCLHREWEGGKFWICAWFNGSGYWNWKPHWWNSWHISEPEDFSFTKSGDRKQRRWIR